MGDDFRNRDEGFNDPVESRNFGHVERDPTAGNYSEPVKRGFSFNLSDIPREGAHGQASSRAQGPRWNPFEGMRRNWDETRQEAAVGHTEAPHMHGPGIFPHSHPALPSSALPPGYPGGAPGILEGELFRTEERVHALRTKLSRLEADMVHGANSPVSGCIRIAVTHLVAGGHLGLSMRGCLVGEVVAPEAREFGWFVGDRVLKVNGYPVESEPEFAREVGKAMDGYRMTGRPLVFDVFREPHQGMMSPGKGGGMGSFPVGKGGKGGYSFMGQAPPPYGQPPFGPPMMDPQLQQLAEENFHLRQGIENQMIGQSMILSGPSGLKGDSFKGGKGSFPTMGGKGGPMGPFDTRSGTPPASMSQMTIPPSNMTMAPQGMMLPPSSMGPASFQTMMPPTSMGFASYPGGPVSGPQAQAKRKKALC